MGRTLGFVVGGVVVALGLAACSSSSSNSAASSDGGADSGPPPPASVSFPSTFLWGSATAGFQVEKDDSNTDWAAWVATPGKIANGDSPDVGGPDALDHIPDDVANMKSAGLNAYRFSIEWGRLYPTLADFMNDTPDPTAIAAYDSLLSTLKAAGIVPIVTISHYALPNYVADITQSSQPYGWETAQTGQLFTQLCTRMGARYGDRVDTWVTINEPINVALAGYLQGSFPPGLVLDADRTEAVVKAQALAHVACFDALHAADTVDADGDGKAAVVSLALNMAAINPYDPTSSDDAAAVERVDYVYNQWFWNAVVKGDWDDDFDGTLTGPNDKTNDPSLAGRADYLGVNYYLQALISAHRGLIVPVINAAIYEADLPTTLPKTDFGWDIYPQGFGRVLDEAATYGKPILVTENGIADHADVMRARFLAEHLFQLGWAMQRGDDILGYVHWALVDNFEWASGYCPHFGLFSYDPTTGTRTARASLATFSHIVSTGVLKQSDIDALPAYGSPTSCP
jgi:beta-glucosidase/6-phospho-beta-glucosidase/beta-galactosidase